MYICALTLQYLATANEVVKLKPLNHAVYIIILSGTALKSSLLCCHRNN